MPYQASASALLACVFISLLKNLPLGTAIDYVATLKTPEILRASKSKMEHASEQHWTRILHIYLLHIWTQMRLRSQRGAYNFYFPLTFWTFGHCDTTSGLKFFYSIFSSLVLEDARWSRGDSGRPARSHKVTISIQVIPSKIHVIEDAFQLYDLTVVQ